MTSTEQNSRNKTQNPHIYKGSRPPITPPPQKNNKNPNGKKKKKKIHPIHDHKLPTVDTFISESRRLHLQKQSYLFASITSQESKEGPAFKAFLCLFLLAPLCHHIKAPFTMRRFCPCRTCVLHCTAMLPYQAFEKPCL